MAMNEGDLDVFLTSVESKLRAPFSSLEISRAIATAPCSREYLETIAKVLPRMDKVIQLRLLIGLAGVEPSQDTNTAIYNLLTQAQDKSLYEDWTRVAAGLVQGILFSNDSGERDVGKEATEVLTKACGGADAKKLLEQQAKQQGGEFDAQNLNGILDQRPKNDASLETIDLNPLFAPYYYSLLNPETLERILPESMSNPHFAVNEKADILNEDERREREEHTVTPSISKGRATQEVAPAALPPAIMPGRKSTTAKPKPKAPAAKSSMFLPTKKPTAMVAGRMGRQMGNTSKPVTHTRKAGAAQRLLGKSRQLGQKAGTGMGSGASGATASAGGRAMKFGNARSKMKMIDVSEVSELNKERQERETKEPQEQKSSAKKRKIMEAAAAKGLVSAKKSKSNNGNEQATPMNAPPPAVAAAIPNGPGRLEQAAAAALLAYQQQSGAHGAESGAPPSQIPQAALTPGNKEELDVLLEKSNKLSEENRIRVKQFWIDRFNPTPEMPVVRMKLHEEKGVDPETGQTVKETDYLELDYNTFGYKKLRKTKKK